MTNSHSFVKRVLLGGGLALGIVATAVLGGSTAGADAPPRSLGIAALCGQSGCIAPPISALTVQAFGTEATLAFTTIEPAAVTLDYKPVTAPTAGSQSPAQGYATTHEHKLPGLKSNTAYDVTVTAQTQAG